MIHYIYSDKVLVSYGIINDIEGDNIIHYCNSGFGSSGSPIIKILNHKIIGIHRGGDNHHLEFNKGTYLKEPINNFIKFSALLSK